MLELDPYAPRAARHHVAQVDRPSPDLRDAAVLLSSELVTRAVELCPGADVELRVWMPVDVVRVEVRAVAAALAEARWEGGSYGPLVLDQVADRWDLEVTDEGACIWFEIDRVSAAVGTGSDR